MRNVIENQLKIGRVDIAGNGKTRLDLLKKGW